MALTTIAIEKETRDELKTLGVKGETWDQLMRRLIVSTKQEKPNKTSLFKMFGNEGDLKQ